MMCKYVGSWKQREFRSGKQKQDFTLARWGWTLAQNAQTLKHAPYTEPAPGPWCLARSWRLRQTQCWPLFADDNAEATLGWVWNAPPTYLWLGYLATVCYNSFEKFWKRGERQSTVVGIHSVNSFWGTELRGVVFGLWTRLPLRKRRGSLALLDGGQSSVRSSQCL